jgi:hypothetical protein
MRLISKAIGIRQDMSSYSNRPRIIGEKAPLARIQVNWKIKRKQQGLCKKCNREIHINEPVLSRGRIRKYYHVECATRLNII